MRAKIAVERAAKKLRKDVVLDCAHQHYIEHIPHRVVDSIRQKTIERENAIVGEVVKHAAAIVCERTARQVGHLVEVGFQSMWQGTETAHLRDEHAKDELHPVPVELRPVKKHDFDSLPQALQLLWHIYKIYICVPHQ